MTVLPTVHQFPTINETYTWLEQGNGQCIWYLPDKGRRCKVPLGVNEKQQAFKLAATIFKVDDPVKIAPKTLAQIAEQCCCARHHRNKVWGSGLADSLAIRWQAEICNLLSATRPEFAHLATCKSISPPARVTGYPHFNLVHYYQARNDTDSHCAPKEVAFSRHFVLEGETLISALLSEIDPQAGKIGTVYVFTYGKSAFHGMLKIGFTTQLIMYRMGKWTECGHGSPTLLKQYHNTRHPGRVELLTHFELLDYWYALRWCSVHRQAHIEWFKMEVPTADQIIRFWSLWMERANPYDRRGHLRAFWQDMIAFLNCYQIPITAELMMQIQEVEEGLLDLTELLDDDVLRRVSKDKTKHERVTERCSTTSSQKQTTADRSISIKHEVDSIPIKKEITNSSHRFGRT